MVLKFSYYNFLGPLLALIVDSNIDYYTSIITINRYTNPAVLFFFIWFLFLPFIFIYFNDNSKEFKRENESYADQISKYYLTKMNSICVK